MALLSTLRDDFNDNSLNGTVWGTSNTGGGSVTETNQRLQVACSTTLGIGSVFSQNTFYDMNDSSVQAKIVSVSAGASMGAEMSVGDESGEAMTIRVRSTNVLAFRKDNTDLATLTYNSTTHAYWRIRKSGTTIYFDTSTDGQSWTNQASTTTAFDYDSVSVSFTTFNQAGTATHIYVDDLNVYDHSITVQDASLGLTDDLGMVNDDTSPTIGTSIFGGFGSTFFGSSYFGAGSVTVYDILSQPWGYITITADNISLVEHKTLSVNDALLGLTADNLALTEQTTLTVQDALITLTVGNVAFTNAILTMDDALIGLSTDNISLIQQHTLAIQDAVMGLTADSPTLVYNYTLVVQDASMGLSANTIALVQQHALQVQDALIATGIDNLSIILVLNVVEVPVGVFQPREVPGGVIDVSDALTGVYQPVETPEGVIEEGEDSSGSWTQP